LRAESANISLRKSGDKKPSGSSVLNTVGADKGELTSEALQLYYAKANRNSVAYFEYRLGLHMEILKGLS
jgi:hypothetical protein